MLASKTLSSPVAIYCAEKKTFIPINYLEISAKKTNMNLNFVPEHF